MNASFSGESICEIDNEGQEFFHRNRWIELITSYHSPFDSKCIRNQKSKCNKEKIPWSKSWAMGIYSNRWHVNIDNTCKISNAISFRLWKIPRQKVQIIFTKLANDGTNNETCASDTINVVKVQATENTKCRNQNANLNCKSCLWYYKWSNKGFSFLHSE